MFPAHDHRHQHDPASEGCLVRPPVCSSRSVTVHSGHCSAWCCAHVWVPTLTSSLSRSITMSSMLMCGRRTSSSQTHPHGSCDGQILSITVTSLLSFGSCDGQILSITVTSLLSFGLWAVQYHQNCAVSSKLCSIMRRRAVSCEGEQYHAKESSIIKTSH
jgi:hypothetical protein